MALLSQAKRKLVSDGSRNSKALPLQTLASVESLSVPPVQEVVLSADMQCAECQQRIADIMAKMIETESVTINLSEKKVTLTGKYSVPSKLTELQLTSTDHSILRKIATIKRIFRSSYP